MIGLYIRNFRHLTRSVGNTSKKVLVSTNRHQYISGEIINANINSSRKGLFIFQNQYEYHNSNEFSRYNANNEKCNELSNKYRYCMILSNEESLRESNLKIIVLPDDFDETFTEYGKNNRKLFDPLYSKYSMDRDNGIWKFLYTICHDTPNLYVWAIKNYYGHHVPMFNIISVLRWNENYNQLVSKLHKGTITAYNSYDGINSLMEEIRILRQNKRANDSINQFNTNQKKLLKAIELNNRQLIILGKFGRLSKVKQINFVRKMSTVEDINELFHQMAFLVDIHFEWNKDSLIDYIKNTDGINCEIVLNENNFILLKTNNYESIKKIAKNTNWCISKNKKYWNDYIGNSYGEATQYVLCDFSKQEDEKLSIVGFTINMNKGITNAHNFTNDNLMGENLGQISNLTSILGNNKCNIYDILRDKNISLSSIVHQDIEYEWNKEAFIKYLNECVSDENYIIYYDENNKLVLSVHDENVKYIFGEVYNEKFDGDLSNMNHFLFLDFDKSINDESKLLFGVISNDYITNESFCNEIYNGLCNVTTNSFDSLLEQYDLPYTIIPRTDNVVTRFFSAFETYDLSTVNKLLGYEDVRNTLLKDNQEENMKIHNILQHVMCNYKSMDYMNAIYQNGMTIGSIIGGSALSSLAYSVLNNLVNIHCDVRLRIPSIGDIEDYYADRIQNSSFRLYVGTYIMFKTMLEHEEHLVLLDRISQKISNFSGDHPIIQEILNNIINIIDLTKENTASVNFLKVISNYNLTTLLEKVSEMNITNKNLLNVIVSYLRNKHPLYDKFNELFNSVRESIPQKQKTKKMTVDEFKVKVHSTLV